MRKCENAIKCTHNSLQAYSSFRHYTVATSYLQHGGCDYCRQNDVTLASRITFISHAGVVQCL